MSEYDRVSTADDSQRLVEMFVESLTITVGALAKSTYDVNAPRETDVADYRRMCGKRRDAIEHRVHELCEALGESRRDVVTVEAVRAQLAATLNTVRQALVDARADIADARERVTHLEAALTALHDKHGTPPDERGS